MDEAGYGRRHKGWFKQGRWDLVIKCGFWVLIRLLHGKGESGHPHLLGIRPYIKRWSLCILDAIFFTLTSGSMDFLFRNSDMSFL